MTKYLVEAKSRKDLRNLALIIRKTFHLENEIYFPVIEFFEMLPNYLEGFNYEIVEDSFFPEHIHADTVITHNLIRVKESVYLGACKGNGQDRMTIMHEIAHWLTLCLLGFKLERNFFNNAPSYKDPEWQAKCLAGEIMMPFHLVSDYSIKNLSKECGVSMSAAKYQRKIFRKELKNLNLLR